MGMSADGAELARVVVWEVSTMSEAHGTRERSNVEITEN
jgi:hypothetical protein